MSLRLGRPSVFKIGTALPHKARGVARGGRGAVAVAAPQPLRSIYAPAVSLPLHQYQISLLLFQLGLTGW